MKIWKVKNGVIAIVAGTGLLATGAAFAYWQYLQHQWCVQFTSSGGQEVTYSRGCYNPERYKKWTTTALATSGIGSREPGRFELTLRTED